jgi:hypothetical protein
MPDDRMLHRCQGYSAKLSQCDHLTYRVWTQYLLSADDFGVMPDSAAIIRGANFALEREPEAAVVAALAFIKQIGLVEPFAHQGRQYLCSLAWQDFQGVRFPRASHYPVPPTEVFRKLSRRTAELFQRHSARARVLEASQPLAHANGLRLSTGGGAGEGTPTPRVATGPHRSHAFCSIACVPAFLHREFRTGLNRPDEDEADAELRAGYLDHVTAWPAGKPTGDAVHFWRAWYRARYPAPTAKELAGEANSRAIDAWVNRKDTA